MSEIKKFKCDKCGNEFAKPYITVDVPSLRFKIGRESLHICENCANEFAHWIGVKIPVEEDDEWGAHDEIKRI